MKKLEFKFGGHPVHNDDADLIQSAYAEGLKAIISIFDASLNVILSGFIITDDGTTISCTSGYISWQGEVYSIPSTSFAKVVGGNLYLNLVSTVLAPSPVLYKDQTLQNVHIDRTLQLKYYSVGDVGEYVSAFARTSALGFKQGMIFDYIGNVNTNFDVTGLGINAMSGFACCNGNTFTISGGVTLTVPDLRGRTRIGASNIPNQGAPTYNTTILSSPQIGVPGGSAFITLTKSNLPNYNLPITDIGHYHFGVVDEQFNSGNFPYEVGRGIAADRSVVTSYGKSSGGGKESYYLAGSATGFPTKQPTLSPTSIGKSSDGLTVSSGGAATPFDGRGAWWAGIPVIKL